MLLWMKENASFVYMSHIRQHQSFELNNIVFDEQFIEIQIDFVENRQKRWSNMVSTHFHCISLHYHSNWCVIRFDLFFFGQFDVDLLWQRPNSPSFLWNRRPSSNTLSSHCILVWNVMSTLFCRIISGIEMKTKIRVKDQQMAMHFVRSHSTTSKM